MAQDATAALSFGAEIPDQYNTITDSLSSHIHLTHDVSHFLSERAALEREYAGKLSALTRKFKDKREKRVMECVVGSEPAKVWSQQVAERSTLQRYLHSAVTATEGVCNDHNALAGNYDSLAADVEAGAKKAEDMRKKHNAFYQKLIADREKTYAERNKAKAKYDETCHELESHRAKLEKQQDSDRAKKALQAAEEDMWNAKNIYLVAISASNRAQSRFYTEDLPRVQDDVQSLLTLTDRALTSNVQRMTSHTASHSEAIVQKNRAVESDAQSVDLAVDQDVFAEFNRRRFDMPQNFAFEPCQGFFDTEEMSTDSTAAKTFLQNMLIRKQKQLSEAIPIIESKAKEIAGLTNLRDAYLAKRTLGDPAEVTDNLLESIRSAIVLEVSAALLDAEIQTISASIGNDSLNTARPHLFESKAFTIPATCQLCQGKIFGLNRQGCVCRSCSYTCHQKCEPKVPATCRAAPAGASASASGSLGARTLDRTASVRTATSGSSGGGGGARAATGPAAGPSQRRTVAAPPSSSTSASSPPPPRAKVLYAYEATSPNELTISEGQVLSIVEQDNDGSGWITVQNTSGQQGLVPENYTLRMVTAASDGSDDDDGSDDEDNSEEEGHATATSGTSRVRALYSHTASADDELSIAEGETITLTSTGFDVGNGWCEGVNQRGQRGVFPANYVERV